MSPRIDKCPNCGAPTPVAWGGMCGYCGTETVKSVSFLPPLPSIGTGVTLTRPEPLVVAPPLPAPNFEMPRRPRIPQPPPGVHPEPPRVNTGPLIIGALALVAVAAVLLAVHLMNADPCEKVRPCTSWRSVPMPMMVGESVIITQRTECAAWGEPRPRDAKACARSKP